jgi:ribosomal protein L7/L12
MVMSSDGSVIRKVLLWIALAVYLLVLTSYTDAGGWRWNLAAATWLVLFLLALRFTFPVLRWSAANAAFDDGPCTVRLEDAGPERLQVARTLQDALGLDARRARALTEAGPYDLAAGISRDDARRVAGRLRRAGATVSVHTADADPDGPFLG